jgi:PPM family protein phosphatase
MAVATRHTSELQVTVAALSACGPVRDGNEDHAGLGRVGLPDSSEHGPVRAAEGASETYRLPTRPVVGGGHALVFAMADGLGGHGGGDVASQLAIEALLDSVAAAASEVRPPTLLRTAFDQANQAIMDGALAGLGARRMQSTMTALMLTSQELFVAHVGDCRAYRMRRGRVEALTRDHTAVEEMVRLHLIDASAAATHPGRHALTRSLGADISVHVDQRHEPLIALDAFLLCTDGVWPHLTTRDIAAALRADPGDACQELVQRSIERGGDDNASAMIVRVDHARPTEDRPRGWRRLYRR